MVQRSKSKECYKMMSLLPQREWNEDPRENGMRKNSMLPDSVELDFFFFYYKKTNLKIGQLLLCANTEFPFRAYLF